MVSGASTVPCLSSAVLDYYGQKLSKINSLKYGIAPALKSDRGLAITEAVLLQLGKPLKSIAHSRKRFYGWQKLYRQKYPVIGKRWMASCDIPDSQNTII